MAYRITLIEGDGIGPEISTAVTRVLSVLPVKIEWERALGGLAAIDECGTPLPQATIKSIRKNKVALKAPLTTPVGKGFRSINVLLRKYFKLYANVRPIKCLGNFCHYRQTNLVVVRENTEDLYSGLEHVVAPGVVESIKVITRKASLRIAEYAFEYARLNKRQKVTSIHKANIMKLTDGLFLDCARKVSKKYPKIKYEEMIVDNACMQLVLNPNQFDILLLENLYGDIISDLCAGLVGGLGLVPGSNIGKDCAIFEAVHGSAPDIAGQAKANPTAFLMSASLMLKYLGEHKWASLLEESVEEVISEGNVLTADLGGKAKTMELAEAYADRLSKKISKKKKNHKK